jgi:hypothetical protein
MPLIPLLPASWPFASRTPLPPMEAIEGVKLPGLDGSWTLKAPRGLVLAQEAEPLGESYGRGGVARAGDLVLRPYRRGGLLRKVNPRLYASTRRFERELAIHRALWEAGFPTVEPVGIAHRRLGAGHEGVFITRHAEGVPWPRNWDLEPRTLHEIARALRALDAWGLLAPDLNATNILVGKQGVLCLDWDRAGFTSRPGSLLPTYRARLTTSLRRLGARAGTLTALLAALEASGG